MKLKYLILVLLFISGNGSYADETSVYHYSFMENREIYLFGDNVRVRKEPDTKKDNVTDILKIGDKVSIVKKTDQVMVIDGYKEYWYKISYKKNNKNSSGYIWGGLFSIAFSVKGEKLFLAGIKKYGIETGFTGECRLVEKGKILSAINFEPHYLPDGINPGAYGYIVSSELKSGSGLKGIEDTFRIFFNYEACGYPRGNVWIGYGNNKIYYIGKDTSISEAGVFRVEESYIFPSGKSGGNDLVILMTDSYDFDERISDYKLTEKKETRYKWKNMMLEPQK